MRPDAESNSVTRRLCNHATPKELQLVYSSLSVSKRGPNRLAPG
jgi:hypothetical protein